MPFKSEAQRKKLYALKAEGKLPNTDLAEWEKQTPAKLPERLEMKKIPKMQKPKTLRAKKVYSK